MSFKTKKYTLIKKAISRDMATFLCNYLAINKQVYDTFLVNRYISPFEKMMGFYEGKEDQIPGSYCTYGDVAMETLMLKLKPIMEEKTDCKLYPAYCYSRIYSKGDELKRHKDRFSCEISATMNLGGDPWPIYINEKTNVGLPRELGGPKNCSFTSKGEGTKICLDPGDMLAYRGCEIEHWRKKFEGNECIQVFLHYNNINTPKARKNMFDKRPHLGLPPWFKKNENN
jgi:hypothetical protein